MLGLEAVRTGMVAHDFGLLVLRCAHDLAVASRSRPPGSPNSLPAMLRLLGGPCHGTPPADLAGALRQAVRDLPEREARVVRLRYDHGLSFQEVAHDLGLAVRKAYALHGAALARLRHDLGCVEDG